MSSYYLWIPLQYVKLHLSTILQDIPPYMLCPVVVLPLHWLYTIHILACCLYCAWLPLKITNSVDFGMIVVDITCPEFYHCKDSVECIQWSLVCDGNPDCPNEDDETDLECGMKIIAVWLDNHFDLVGNIFRHLRANEATLEQHDEVERTYLNKSY